jgi:copper resistance protein C
MRIRHYVFSAVVVVSSLLLPLSVPSAHAHAALSHASPPAGGTVATAPQAVELTFTERLEAAFSTVEVTDGSGARVEAGKAEISGNTMRVALKSLPPGSYKVYWRTVSADSHKTEGSFTFHVGSP